MPRLSYKLIPPLLVLIVLIAQVTVSYGARGADSNGDTTKASQNAAEPRDKRCEDQRDNQRDNQRDDCGTGRHHTRTPTATEERRATRTPTPTRTEEPDNSATSGRSSQIERAGTPSPQ